MFEKLRLRFVGFAMALAALGTVAGCAGPDIQRYANEKPVLKLEQYFNGTLDAYGVFRDRKGEVVKRFTVVMTCTWKGNEGTLDEDFTYTDGTKQRRVWHLTLGPDGAITGRADDVVGEARGAIRGNTLQWNYTLRLPVGNSVYDVQFDDWMFLMNDQVMLNTATMSKFGFKVGEVTLSFVKRVPAR